MRAAGAERGSQQRESAVADLEELQDLASLAELERMFADLGEGPVSARYRGVKFRTRHYGFTSSSMPWALLAPIPMAILERLTSRGLRGNHVIVQLPVALLADMRLESRSRPDEQAGDPLAAHFTLSATSTELVRRYTRGPLQDALVELAGQYHVLMTDRELRFGPLKGSPQEQARTLERVISALPRPVRPRPGNPDRGNPDRE